MPQFGFLDGLTILLAEQGLTQLNRKAIMPMVGVTQFDMKTYFQHNQTLNIRRAKLRGEAENFDPRGGGTALRPEGEFVNVSLVLDRLFTDGFPIFSNDAEMALVKYIKDTSTQCSDAVATAVDNYFYDRAFRSHATEIPVSGPVEYNAGPPLQLTWGESSPGVFAPFTDDLIVQGNAVLSDQQVPYDNRCATLTPFAAADYQLNTLLVTEQSGIAAGGPRLLAEGIPSNAFVSRAGVKVRGFNVDNAFQPVGNVLDTPATEAPVTTITQDTTVFTNGDQTANNVPLGVVNATVTLGGANLSPDVAVGQIARLYIDGGNTLAYGVIVRVASPVVSLVPYAANGRVLTAQDLNGVVNRISIPAIGSINILNHREHLVYAFRPQRPPTAGGGAVSRMAKDPNSQMVFQYFMGDYNVDQFTESSRCSALTGARGSDPRKAVLMLSR